MQSADRKAVWALVFASAVIALELALFLFVGPAHGNSDNTAKQAAYDYFLPWRWDAAGWTAVFTLALTVSTALLWWQTRRLAEGAEDQAIKMVASIDAINAVAAAAAKSVLLTEQSISRTERPYVFILPPETNLRINLKNQIVLRCANHGRTPALLQTIKAELIKSRDAPTTPYTFVKPFIWPVLAPLGTGEKSANFSYDVKRQGNVDTIFSRTNSGARTIVSAPDEKWFYIAMVVYNDPEGREYTTLNCWRFSFKRDGFLRVDPESSHRMT